MRARPREPPRFLRREMRCSREPARPPRKWDCAHCAARIRRAVNPNSPRAANGEAISTMGRAYRGQIVLSNHNCTHIPHMMTTAVQNNAWWSRRAQTRRHPQIPPNINSANTGPSPRVIVGINTQIIRPTVIGRSRLSSLLISAAWPASDRSHNSARARTSSRIVVQPEWPQSQNRLTSSNAKGKIATHRIAPKSSLRRPVPSPFGRRSRMVPSPLGRGLG